MEMGAEGYSGSEEDRGEGGDDDLMTACAAGWLTREELPGVPMIIDARNGFNKLSRLAMILTVRHRWLTGAQFNYNCYKHLAELLLR